MPVAVAAFPIFPDYPDRCVSNIAPAVLGGFPAAMPALDERCIDAAQVVLLVVDGLGWDQLQSRLELAPTLAALHGSAITTVAPSTTASALTSITTGVPPGEHGVVGYRIDFSGDVLNALRWTTPLGDARDRIIPSEVQPIDPFLGRNPPVVTRTEFANGGFTAAHLAGGTLVGYRTIASLVLETQRALDAGAPFVFSYYDGLDRIGHEYGHGEHYDAELRWIDRLVAEIVDHLPSEAALIVTADHGQVECPPGMFMHEDITTRINRMSGEARFRWLHCDADQAEQMANLVREHHGSDALVASIDQVLEEKWLGPVVTSASRRRLGQVAVVAKGTAAFLDPADGGHGLIGRHGSFTSAEMMVPLLQAFGSD